MKGLKADTRFLGAGILALVASVTTVNAQTVGSASPATQVFLVAPDGNSARYYVQEQLVGFDLPNYAIGETLDIKGQVAFDTQGKIVSGQSNFTVGVSTLKSDKDRRDGYVRSRLLETDKFPTVTFVPTTSTLSALPEAGQHTFSVTGNLTVKGVTRSVTWTFDATFSDDAVTGKATTTFKFADFGLTKPRVPVLLSVEDDIRLEYTFRLIEGR